MASQKHASAEVTAVEIADEVAGDTQLPQGNQTAGELKSDEQNQSVELNPNSNDAHRPQLSVVDNATAVADQAAVDVADDTASSDATPEAASLSDADPVVEELVVADAPIVQAESLVHEGSDGWLFLVAGTNHVLNMYKNKSSFTPSMAKGWVKLLQERADRLSADGIQYLHLPAPEKLTVLHKFYQGDIENIAGSPISQMADNHAADVPCMVNVLPYFAKQVDETLLYWKTDTHWSFWGCFSAYQLLCGRMGVKPNTDLLKYPFSEGQVLFDLGAKLEEPLKESARFYQLTQNASRSYANTIVRYKEEQGLINEANLHVGSSVVYRNESANAVDKCVVLFGDSFSEYRDHLLTGMLAETFREVHFIWNGSIDYAYVNRVQPDVVITELAERFMTRVPEDKLDIQKFAADRLKAFKPETKESGHAMNFSLPESVIVEDVLMPSETYHLHPPKVVQDACKNIGNDQTMKSNPIRLVQIEKARVFFTGDRLLVRAPGGEVVSRYGVSEKEFSALPWKEHRKLNGTVMLLGNSMGAHCYYHWMLDLLPKLGMLEKAGIPLSSIDHFLVREMNGSFQKQTLARLGIDASRVVETKNDNRLECENLLMLNFDNGINMKMNRFIPNWIKHVYPPQYPVGKRIKLYISRPKGVRRGVANEAQMLPILRRAGYTIESMEGMSVVEQAQLLARADVVMSPHGGALTNMVFCRPGIKVVELFGRHVYPFYYGLAQMCGHEYHTIVENPEDYPRLIQFTEANKVGSADFQKNTREKSFDVDLETLKATIDALET